MNIPSIKNSFVQIDTFCDKIPVLSSVTNLLEIFAKAVLFCYSKIKGINGKELTDRQFTHLNDKSLGENFILLVPLINIAAACWLQGPTKEEILKNPNLFPNANNRLKNDKEFILAVAIQKQEEAIASFNIESTLTSKAIKDLTKNKNVPQGLEEAIASFNIESTLTSKAIKDLTKNKNVPQGLEEAIASFNIGSTLTSKAIKDLTKNKKAPQDLDLAASQESMSKAFNSVVNVITTKV